MEVVTDMKINFRKLWRFLVLVIYFGIILYNCTFNNPQISSSYPCQPVLEIEEEIYFGNLVANSKTISKEISLFNHGSKSGEFKLKYSGDKPIAIMPSSGSVPSKSVQLIKVYINDLSSIRFVFFAHIHLAVIILD